MDLAPDERVLFSGHPSWRATLSFYLKGLLVTVVEVIIARARAG